MLAEASQPFENVLGQGTAGLVGTLAVKVVDNDGATTIGPTTANITEVAPGVYAWNAPAAPAALGSYTIIWSDDGSFDEDTNTIEELVVVASLTESLPPVPAPDDATPVAGPCASWLTGDDVVECCQLAEDTVGTFTSLLDDVAGVASQLLYEFSGRRFSGLCSRTVRPCHTDCSCGIQVLSRGHVVSPNGTWPCAGIHCGCQSLSRVLLSGYVREVTQVKIDGDVVAASGYRVDENRWLTRLDGERWPACARLDLADTEEGSFSVTYTYGVPVPLMGVEAAKELACQVFAQCSGVGECKLPRGATRVTRQGVTIERQFFRFDPQAKAWRTGLVLVDAFLNAVNPYGLRRRPAIWSPASHLQYARPVG